MILNNVKIAGTDPPVNIRVDEDKIMGVSSSGFVRPAETLQLTFDNAIIFPGLINSHDHLDFNLFPQLGTKTYNNYTEWGRHIHKAYKGEIADVLKIPGLLRAGWGIYKNLLCGVTTVVNHGEKLATHDDLITVFEETQSLHSVHFEKRWQFKLNNPYKIKLPAAIHVGEGDDWLSFSEIDKLTRWNLFKKKLVGVHGVAMSGGQAKKFEAIVWCPQSNYFLLKKTAAINLLKKNTNILFGTDSTLTSSWDIWEHLQLARKTGMLNDEILYYSLNKSAAATWQLNCGEIANGRDADLVVAKIKHNKTGFDAFFSLNPADLLLVMHKGNIRLFDETLLTQLRTIDLNDFSEIYINGAHKYVQGDLPGLMENIRKYNPEVNFPVSLTKPD
jgi:cytosine/adenosine deaminase-related metal-dependent hydrolase